MNRSIAYVGVALIVGALAMFAYPEVATGQETLGPTVELGVFVLGWGFAALLWAGASPNPAITTIGGLFGNRDEDLVRRWMNRRPPTGPARFRPGPFETTNCEWCYTAIPARSLECPRCSKPRRCRRCGKPLFTLAGAVRCGPCVKDELFCDCPRTIRQPFVRVRGSR